MVFIFLAYFTLYNDGKAGARGGDWLRSGS